MDIMTAGGHTLRTVQHPSDSAYFRLPEGDEGNHKTDKSG
jgi:hypothetical protein